MQCLTSQLTAERIRHFAPNIQFISSKGDNATTIHAATEYKRELKIL